MANGTASQVQFKWQRPIDRVYRVGSGLKFGAVMSAINAAVADGAQPANPAFIEIYPGLYTENVTFYPGVHLIGMGTRTSSYPYSSFDPGHDVVIQGNHGLNTDLTGPYGVNECFIDVRSIGFFNNAGGLFNFIGANVGRINFHDCFFSKSNADAPVISASNTNANSIIRMFDTMVFPEFNHLAGFAACDISGNNKLEFYGGRSGVDSQDGFIIFAAVKLGGNAVCNINSRYFCSSKFDQVFEFTNGGFPAALLSCIGTTIQNTLSGGFIANFHALNVFLCNFRDSALLVPDATPSKIVNSTANSNLVLMNCTFAGFPPNPFNTIDPTVNVIDFSNAAVDTLRAEFYVGSSRGYATIGAAIAAANVSTANVNGRKTIRIAPGTYLENLTLVHDIDLIADSPEENAVNNCPVIITGNHTWAAAAGSIKCKGIFFNNDTTAGVIVNMTGAVGGELLLEQCYVQKTQNDHTAPFLATGTGGILLKNTSIFFEDDSVACFVFAGATNFNLLIDGNLVGNVGDPSGSINSYPIVFKPKTLTIALTPFLFTGSASNVTFRNAEFSIVSQTFVVVSGVGASVNVMACKINLNTIDGQYFKFAAAGNVICTNSFLNTVVVPGDLGVAFVARDAGLQANGNLTVTGTPTAGVQATGTVTLTGVADGDNTTINGQLITFRTLPTLPNEVAIGGSDNNAATNLATYLNTTSSGLIAGIVTGVAALNVVTVTSVDGSLATNGITLVSGSGSIAVSGATLTGGLDGDTLDINGQILMFGPGPIRQIATSGVPATQALNIATFLDGLAQSGTYPNIFQKVYAFYLTTANVLTVKAFDTGTTLNGATLTYTPVGAPAITAPGTLTGGTAGGGGNFVYGGMAMKKQPPFNQVFVQASLNIEATLSLATAV